MINSIAYNLKADDQRYVGDAPKTQATFHLKMSEYAIGDIVTPMTQARKMLDRSSLSFSIVRNRIVPMKTPMKPTKAISETVNYEIYSFSVMK